jgi:hypothetical protein
MKGFDCAGVALRHGRNVEIARPLLGWHKCMRKKAEVATFLQQMVNRGIFSI